MYCESMISVGKANNGFIVECRVPFKRDMKPSSKTESCCCMPCGPSGTDKQYIAKDAQEVGDLIEDLMPLLDGDYKNENDFDKAFEAATSAMNAEEKGEK